MNAIVEQKTGMLAALERRGISEFQWRALVNSVFPGAKSESIMMAIDYCLARNLDVMKKPCHIVPMSVTNSKTGAKEWRDVIMPGIFELRVTAARTGQYAGMDEPEYGPPIEYTGVTAPEWCKITVYRLVGSDRCDFSHVERFAECVGTTNDRRSGEVRVNSMWTKRPYGQIAKVAEAGALRKAFPEEIGGQYAAEEFAGSGEGAVHHEPRKAGMRAKPEARGVAALEQAIQREPEPPIASEPEPEPQDANGSSVEDVVNVFTVDEHGDPADDDLPV